MTFHQIRHSLGLREPTGRDQTTSVEMTSIHQTRAPRERLRRREEQR